MRQKLRLDMVKFHHVLTSSAIRTQETARILIGDDAAVMLTPIPVLYSLPDEQGAKICEDMFNQLGYANLLTYLLHGDADTLMRLGRTGAKAILDAIDEPVSGKNVLIVSHAVLLNVLIYHMFPMEVVKKVALMANLPECGSIEVICGDSPANTIVHIIN
jgi:broad specificity phosphatase PhoE